MEGEPRLDVRHPLGEREEVGRRSTTLAQPDDWTRIGDIVVPLVLEREDGDRTRADRIRLAIDGKTAHCHRLAFVERLLGEETWCQSGRGDERLHHERLASEFEPVAEQLFQPRKLLTSMKCHQL